MSRLLTPSNTISRWFWDVIRVLSEEGEVSAETSRSYLVNSANIQLYMCIKFENYIYTRCPRRNVSDFGRVFLMLKYTDITQNTYVQSWTVTEIMAREKCGLLAGPRTVPFSWQSYPCPSVSVGHMTAIQLTPALNCICISFREMT